MKDETIIVCVSMPCLVAALGFCLAYGFDHLIVGTIVTAIATPLGYFYRKRGEST